MIESQIVVPFGFESFVELVGHFESMWILIYLFVTMSKYGMFMIFWTNMSGLLLVFYSWDGLDFER
jgi:hypothetical protein